MSEYSETLRRIAETFHQRATRDILEMAADHIELLDKRNREYDATIHRLQQIVLSNNYGKPEAECNGKQSTNPEPVASLLDELCQIESERIGLQGKYQALHRRACKALGCGEQEDTDTSEAAFDLIYNSYSAESVMATFEREKMNLV